MTISPRPRRAKSEDEDERGARSLMGASIEVATSTITGVPNTLSSAWHHEEGAKVSLPRRCRKRVER